MTKTTRARDTLEFKQGAVRRWSRASAASRRRRGPWAWLIGRCSTGSRLTGKAAAERRPIGPTPRRVHETQAG